MDRGDGTGKTQTTVVPIDEEIDHQIHPRKLSTESSSSSSNFSLSIIQSQKMRWICDKAERNLIDLVLSQSLTIPPHMMSREVGKFLMWTKPVEGALFVFGGRSGRLGDARQYLKTVEYLDPVTLQWNRAPDMKYARVGLAAAYMDGFYYVIGGYNQVNGDPQHSVEKLDVETLTWSTCSSLLIPRYGHSACACDGKIYVMGGDHQGVLVPFAERYDPDTDQWERIPDMPLRVAAARATCIDGKIFLFGGCDPSVPGDRASDAILVFDPVTMRWSISSKRMRRGRTAFSLAAVGFKRKGVMIAGGFDLSTRPEIEMSSVEVIEDLMADGTTANSCHTTKFPELPIPRAGCQGVSIPTNFLPVSFDKASPYPMIVLGGEYIDPVTGSCKVFDSATMLVTREFANRMTQRRDAPEWNNATCGGGIKFTAGRIIMNALKRRRGQFGFGTQLDEQDHDLVWSDTIIPPMTKKRTAFAACIGTAWPKGYGATSEVAPQDAELYISEIHYRYRSRSLWPDLLHEWLQGNVL